MEFEIRDVPAPMCPRLSRRSTRSSHEQRRLLKAQAEEADIVVTDIASYPSLMTADERRSASVQRGA